MKFLDIINESEEERLLKRGKTIFRAFKEGTITRTDGVSFSYVLDNNVEMMVRNGELELYGSVFKIVENTYCPINERYMTELIENRFRKFYITTDLRPPSKDNIHKFQGKKPWELSEDAKLLTKEDPSEEKRVRTIFKALKKGVVKVQHPRTDEIIKFRYNIDNVSYKWEHYTMMEKHLTIVTDNFPGEGITIYCDDEDIVDKCTNDLESMSRNPTGFHLREMFVNKLKSKFDTFNVSIQVNKRGMKFVLDKQNEPINESNEDKLIRKGKLIFKALRNGTIGSDDKPNEPRFTYELSTDISVRIDDGNIIIFTPEVKIVELNRACRIISADLMAHKIRKRFEQFKVILHHPPIISDNVDTDLKREVNEQNISRREPNKEQKKRARIFYDAFKTGKFTVEGDKQHNEHGGTYKYVLPDEYWISIDDDGELCVILTMNPEQRMMMYYTNENNEGKTIEKYIDPITRKHLYQWMVDSIKKKFRQFQINIIF
jgi:hypothetical protein